jgi:hypothetical protein
VEDPRCTVIHESANDPQPDDFNNREWLVSPFTEDGTNIYALVHNEFHGWDDPGTYCPNFVPGRFNHQCWYNAITLAKSTDQGASYTRFPTLDGQLVASIPYRYSWEDVPNQSTDSKGYFQPTNVVKKGDWFYILFRAEQFGAQQPRGSCVARTQTPQTPSSWRAYDGNASGPNDGFNVTFVDPYPVPPEDPENHVCFPVLGPDRPPEYPDKTGTLANNLVFSRYFNKYMIIDSDLLVPPGETGGSSGVWYSLSSDLTHWERPKLLMKGPRDGEGCQENPPQPGFRHPTLLDHNSTDRNFNTIGQTAYLYFTKSNLLPEDEDGPCQESLDRDLVRVPIRFTKKPEPDRLATLEGSSVADVANGGFDRISHGSGGFITQDYTRYYDGAKSAWLYTGPTATRPWGGFNTRAPDGSAGWPNGTDVWFGSAFYLPAPFKNQIGRMMLMRWLTDDSDANPNRYGGVALNTDDTYRLVRGSKGPPASENNLGPSFTLPENRWFNLEVHQRLGSSASNKPLSEVFVDGKLVASSSAVNSYPDGIPMRANFGFAQATVGGSSMSIWMDNAYTATGQRGPKGAPATPTGLSGSEGNGYITLSWNTSSDLNGGGYRVYRDQGDGTWAQTYQTSAPAYLQTGLPNCSRQRYRITAYKGTGIGEESAHTEEIEMRPQTTEGC